LVRREAKGSQSILRKLVLGTLIVLGGGYALNSVPMIIMFEYRFSQLSISSLENILEITGILLFMLASVVFSTLGVLLIVGAIKYYRGRLSRGIISLGALLGSFYLLCLGIGSVLLTSEINLGAIFLTISSMLFMIAVAAYLLGSYRFRVTSSILGFLGGILFTFAIFPTLGLQIFQLALADWGVPFLGPFMSFTVIEGPALVIGSAAALGHSMLTRHRKGPAKYVFYSIATLVYGVGLFVGPLILSLSFLDLLWKAPWAGEVLNNEPRWVLGTVTFWSASLVMLVLGGILLILTSFAGFVLAFSTAKE
jgi:hypothetical protein